MYLWFSYRNKNLEIAQTKTKTSLKQVYSESTKNAIWEISAQHFYLNK